MAMLPLEADDESDDEHQFLGGHWTWSDKNKRLEFISGFNEASPYEGTAYRITYVFDENVDVFEQQRYARKYGRRLGGVHDCVILQDIKDVVLYTTPDYLFTEKLVKTMHTPAYDRFIRALIVYVEYFLQLSYVLDLRKSEGKQKIRLPASDDLEMKWAKNLSDIRAVVAKEYFYFTFEDKFTKGTNVFAAEARATEIFCRISLQIVWVALGRYNFDEIATEIGRLIRSERFNPAHGAEPPMESYEKDILHGDGRHELQESSSKTSPNDIMNPFGDAMFKYNCDFKLMCIGVVGFEKDDERMTFFEKLFCAPEEHLSELNINVGILGKPRENFDAMLREIVRRGKKTGSSFGSSQSASRVSSKKSFQLSSSICQPKFIPDAEDYPIPSRLPEVPPKFKQRPPDLEQKRKWIKLCSRGRRRTRSVIIPFV